MASRSVTDGKFEFEILVNLCNTTIKLFRAASKMGHAEGGNVHARFAAWHISAMAIKLSALESTRRVL